ncbi:5,6-dimethylbenzimidazole synthase [Dinoroseobacter sp. PD6]|uniref:5,6-dimethylbenzimidazole synthase n=1 Tax=Dinoroseobacter sp. PD6 TaxID=3028384 RepID=UPI00237C05AE|nr:5,6-dimethylbenzimidazole synthase [Dinoroseobacter sp. PD6]MDD9718890.1 5,6-dimethylbenzimidazole synthase [Dinoroseobacter sp. PD6]
MRSFTPAFRAELTELMRWRRDVRRFRTDPVPDAVLARCLDSLRLAPSVGLSEPWRVLRIDSPAARAAAAANFAETNADALAGQPGDKAADYARLKLSGMDAAPVQLAIYCDTDPTKGSGLGAASMPQMRQYSVVSGVTMMWLTARAEGLGLGWVSILDPDRLARDLAVPATWDLIGYFCLGWPEDEADTPELERLGWEARAEALELEVR